MKRKRGSHDEQEAFSRYARSIHHWRRGAIRRLKRISAKRERRIGRREARADA